MKLSRDASSSIILNKERSKSYEKNSKYCFIYSMRINARIPLDSDDTRSVLFE